MGQPFRAKFSTVHETILNERCMRSLHRSLTKDQIGNCHCSDEGSSNHRGSAHHQPRSGKHIDSQALGHCFIDVFVECF